MKEIDVNPGDCRILKNGLGNQVEIKKYTHLVFPSRSGVYVEITNGVVCNTEPESSPKPVLARKDAILYFCQVCSGYRRCSPQVAAIDKDGDWVPAVRPGQ